MISLAKDKINPDAQYCVVLNEPTRLKSANDLFLPAGDPITLIGSAAIEVYAKLRQITLVDEETGE